MEHRPRAATMTPPNGLPIVTPGITSWLTLEPEPHATPLARAHTRTILHGDASVDDVELVVAELVTNAVVHAPEHYVIPAGVSPWVYLSLQPERRWILVGVRDPWPGGPQAIHAGAHSVSGRGLSLVEAFSAACWPEYRSVGKTVYALMLRPDCELRPGELDRLRTP